jgi:LPXTG-motif cell wall-anchored protein
MAASPNTVAQGGTFQLTSSGWAPNASLTGTLNSTPVSLGTFVADASGNVSQTITVPAGFAVGAHTVTLTGAVTGVATAVTASVPITVVAADAATTPTTAASTTTVATGTLPVTGSETGGLVELGLVLVGTGAAVLGVSRRRRQS